jgi:curved DNA-binding protein CbpA
MIKNYYKILGVDVLANETEIKKAYRSLAKQYHPDVNQDKEAVEIFCEIKEAYDVLSNPEQRARYDIQLKYTVVPSLATSHAASYEERHHSQFITIDKDNLKKLIIVFLCIMVVAAIVFAIELNYIKNSRAKSMEPGMTISEVVNLYGEPISISETEIQYDNATIILYNGKVYRWYNAFDELKIKNYDIENIDDIKVGEDIEGIFRDYGYPDTYAETFVTYYDVVIMYKNGIVTQVFKTGK